MAGLVLKDIMKIYPLSEDQKKKKTKKGEPKEEKKPLRNIHYQSTPPPPSNIQLISQSVDQVAAVSTRLRRLAYDKFEEVPLYRNLCLSLSALTDKAVQLMGKLLRLESQKENSSKKKIKRKKRWKNMQQL